ncbi:MAG: transglycosylase family protein [Gaiellaceae bacterium]
MTLLALVLAGICGTTMISPGDARAEPRALAFHLPTRSSAILAQIDRYRHETWHWQRVMSLRPTPTNHSASHDPSLRYRVWVRNLWRHRAARAHVLAERVPHKREWLCIHHYEGSWGSATGNGYYGGLQMDIGFQRTYGGDLLRRKGTADRWSPIEQMWVAERARRSGRGFFPWPNTARSCGLI